MSGGSAVFAWGASVVAAAVLAASPQNHEDRAAPAFPAEDAMDVLVTKSGTELRSDARLFTLYAAFNALGYDDAPVSAEKPFARHMFAPMRREVRSRVRLTSRTAEAWEKLLNEAPLDAADYEACALSAAGASSSAGAPSSRREACPGALSRLPMLLLDVWREGNLADFYPAAALNARQQLLPMLSRIDGAEVSLKRRLAGTSETAPAASQRRMTVILNVLSARPAVTLPGAQPVRAVSVGDDGKPEDAFLFDVTRRLAAAMAADACSTSFGRSAPESSDFLTEAMASALAAAALGLDASAVSDAMPGGRDEVIRLMKADLTPARICGQTRDLEKSAR